MPYVDYPHSNSLDNVLSPTLKLSRLSNLPTITGIGNNVVTVRNHIRLIHFLLIPE